MKIRNGFVSNSSSSSFVLACKGEPTESKLLDAFKVPVESPFYDLATKIAEQLVEASKENDFDEEEIDAYFGGLVKKCESRGLEPHFLSISYECLDWCDPNPWVLTTIDTEDLIFGETDRI